MEGIFAIIVIIFSVIAAANGNKNKKKQPTRARPPMRTREIPDVPPVSPPPVVPIVKADEGDSTEDGICVGGSIAHTEHQGESAEDGVCVGGSIPHDAHEGDETSQAARVFEEREDTNAAEDARFTSEDMRRAFIASEIFARPKAMRRS